jgi:hypothetical protein
MIDWMESDKPYLMKQYFADKTIQKAAFTFESIDTGRHRGSPIEWAIGPLRLLRIEPSKTRVQCSHAHAAEIRDRARPALRIDP